MHVLRKVQDYAGAYSLGGVHYKHKPKIAAQFAGIFVFMRLSTCMLNERFRITLARIPWGEFITSKNPKLLRNLRVFLFLCACQHAC
jgi:hypothetical protein